MVVFNYSVDMNKQNQFPQVRIHPAAYQHLAEIYKALKEAGRFTSLTSLAFRRHPCHTHAEWSSASGQPRKSMQGGMNMQINLLNIKASPKPLRTTWDEDKLNELAKSILSQGLIVPIKVRPSNGKYEIVYGHRRVEAARRAGLNAVECLVEEMDTLTSHQQELTENVIREDMTAIDISKALRAEIAETGQTQEEIGKKYGWTGRYVSQNLAITSDERISKIIEGKPANITGQHWLQAIAGSNSKEDAIAVLEKAANEDLSKRQTRAVAEAIAVTIDPNRRKALLETPYSSLLHDPEYNRERAEIWCE